MSYKNRISLLLVLSIWGKFQKDLSAEALSPLLITGISITNTEKQIAWAPYPAAVEYTIQHSIDLPGPYSEDSSGSIAGYAWTAPLAGSSGFYRLQVKPLGSNELLTVTVLNRLAYGPTPDELSRVNALGPQAYIEEQLAPELIQEKLDIDTDKTIIMPGWQYFTATGTGSSTNLYIYLNVPGEGYIDDIMLVSGTKAGVGVNLIRNGDFEAPLTTDDWTISPNHMGSGISTEIQHSGTGSLHLIATSGGTTLASSIWQGIKTPLSNARQYTLSYWYYPVTNKLSSPTVRLSGSGIVSSPFPLSLWTKLNNAAASLDDLRAWHVLHAVRSQKQLLEVLDQFLENHFVTQYSKSRDYFDTFYDDQNVMARLATQLEFKENQKWRQALLNPQCTFYDLLRISAESPAMIIYLDTVNSKGSKAQIANENYARELLELFTFGVDNGYNQSDITTLSKCWTGWSLRLVDATNEFNPFAPESITLIPGAINSAISNKVGVWAFNFKDNNHNTNSKTLFASKVVPDRFGPPYAGRAYQLVLPARAGTNGIQDGYEVLAHFANQPFTQEFLSVKLCRLFVHDDFSIGYDFTDPNLSAEGQLVRQCMQVWENGSPKGQIRQVLGTIFNSELFRGHGGSMQKVKSPLEFVVSAIRTLRSVAPSGAFTAETDGYAMNAPMQRMGGMNLFDRGDPDGYPESAPGWISAGTLAERLRFVQSLLMVAGQSGKSDAGDNNVTDPVGLIKAKLTSTQWTNAEDVADYFLNIIYPAEGKANLNLYRASALKYLDTSDDGVSRSPLSSLSTTGSPSAYETRVRGMVAMLLTFQRFQEQ